jgi:AGCS family alanine or glycine:cation symporter
MDIMEATYEKIRTILETVDSYVWHPFFMVTILLGTGLYLTFRFYLPQFRFFGHAWGLVFGRYDRPEHAGEVSHFQALSAALSATVGIGNIAGVATANAPWPCDTGRSIPTERSRAAPCTPSWAA